MTIDDYNENVKMVSPVILGTKETVQIEKLLACNLAKT